jgi:hypothetical protein
MAARKYKKQIILIVFHKRQQCPNGFTRPASALFSKSGGVSSRNKAPPFALDTASRILPKEGQHPDTRSEGLISIK